jgi:hypothetical protein
VQASHAVPAEVRLRAGRAGSAKGTASMVTEAINTATAAGAWAKNIVVRGDCAYCSGKVIAAAAVPARSMAWLEPGCATACTARTRRSSGGP